MKKKLILAAVLLIGFVSVLTIFFKDSAPTSSTKGPTSQNDRIVFSGENDYWQAAFSVDKTNQLKLTHNEDKNRLPKELMFTLSTAYDQEKKQTEIGAYTFSINQFPNQITVTFDGEIKNLKENKKLVLKITGKDHYQFFNLYKEE
ncbi:hypothetical protein [Fictibacillus norfolkensis]|uniref:Lipoprotein n=1 Tax=Fictibacillus norfolkensis TaxID=2762233 RepID=A0ABR8SJE5_9BACL|nr:hypothetical protein [Fictibacillus norfolkensis]MBD7963606.1 hypothetical protein [Fictibacillus norfolkensis]